MRTIRKRLTIVNRDDASKNKHYIYKAIMRYEKKMTEKGWTLDRNSITTGNSFFRYEAYVSVYKPNPKVQKDNDFIAKIANNNLKNID